MKKRNGALDVMIALGLASAIGYGSAACIFDQGNYQGGGRLGQAAIANQSGGGSSSSSSGDDDDDNGSSSSSSSSGVSIFSDSGVADAH